METGSQSGQQSSTDHRERKNIKTDVASYASITNTDDSVVWYEW